MHYIKFLLIIVILTAFLSRFTPLAPLESEPLTGLERPPRKGKRYRLWNLRYFSDFLTGFKIPFLISSLLASSFLFLSLLQRDTSFLIMALIFLIAPFIPYKFQQRKKRAFDELNVQVNNIESDCQNIAKKSKSIKDLNNTLEKRILQISNLYEIGKELSASLGFAEIFKALAKILLKNFQFQSCYLLVVTDETKDTPSIDKIYRIGLEDHPLLSYQTRIELDEVSECCQKSWETVFKSQKPLFREQIASVPLIAGDEILGILTAENLEESDFDNFSILGGQLALEVRKVKLYERVQELAITDGLTGIFVRRHFLERLHEATTRSLCYSLKLSFLMVDIDHFKRQNDTHGHLVGDVILKETAQILKASLREIDLLCRYGGEEFSIVLPDTDREGALQVAERIRLAVEEYDFRAYEELLKITISVGVAIFPDNANSVQELIDCADSALYRAKQEGRNRVCAI